MLRDICKLILFTCLVGCASTKAQPTIYFNKAHHTLNNFNELGLGVVECNSAYYTIGETATNNAVYQYLVKTDLNGDTLFTRLIGKPNRGYFTRSSLVKTSDNNLVYCGIESLDSINLSYDSSRAMLVKLNFNGDTLWVKRYQYSSNKENKALECFETKDKGFIIANQIRYK